MTLTRANHFGKGVPVAEANNTGRLICTIEAHTVSSRSTKQATLIAQLAVRTSDVGTTLTHVMPTADGHLNNIVSQEAVTSLSGLAGTLEKPLDLTIECLRVMHSHSSQMAPT